ncbi:hypothetical protein V8C37DRAFT_396678 [Trichoderma ceciliae]
MKVAFTSANAISASRIQNWKTLRNIPATVDYQLQYRRPQLRHRASLEGYSLTRSFSRYGALRSKQERNDELPSFSFEGLGMSKGTKIFIIGILSIFGTIETWVWCKGIYRWWKGSEEEKEHN